MGGTPDVPEHLRATAPEGLTALSFLTDDFRNVQDNARDYASDVTVLDDDGQFLIDRMVEVPSRVMEGTAAALEALARTGSKVVGVGEAGFDLYYETVGSSADPPLLMVEGAYKFNQHRLAGTIKFGSWTR